MTPAADNDPRHSPHQQCIPDSSSSIYQPDSRVAAAEYEQDSILGSRAGRRVQFAMDRHNMLWFPAKSIDFSGLFCIYPLLASLFWQLSKLGLHSSFSDLDCNVIQSTRPFGQDLQYIWFEGLWTLAKSSDDGSKMNPLPTLLFPISLNWTGVQQQAGTDQEKDQVLP